MRPLSVVLLILALPGVVRAQHAESPYAGHERRSIKTLAPDTIDQLRCGAGMGLAKAAELNGLPGPRHVLDLAAELELTDAQARRTRVVFERMRESAVALGERIIAAERALDRRFAAPDIARGEVADRTAGIARLWGELRAVHLTAHLEMMEVLSAEQIGRYAELRGYADGGHRHGAEHGRVGADHVSYRGRGDAAERDRPTGPVAPPRQMMRS